MTTKRPAGNPRRVSSSGRRSVSGDARQAPPRPGAPRGAGGGGVAAWWTQPVWMVAALAFALYLPTLGYGFVRDDHDLIAENAFLRQAGWLGRLLVSDFWASSGGDSGLWRPLVVLSYWVDGRLGGFGPAWFHGTNVALHAIAAGWVAALIAAREPGDSPCAGARVAALLAGLWFAAMPVHVESVAWISGRTDVLCALAAVAALWADRRARAAGARWPGTIAVGAFALALLAKEAALPLIVAFAVAERVERADGRPRLGWLAPYAVVAAVYLIAHRVAAPGAGIPAWLDPETLARRHWAGWTMLADDLAFLWPWYPHAPERLLTLPASPGSPAVVAGAALTLGAAGALGVLAWRRSRAALPLAVLLLPLAPPIVLAVARGYVAHAERLLYLPSVGAAWLAALALERAARAPALRLPAVWTGVALVASSAWVTWRLLPDWRNDATMYAAMVRVQPDHAEGHIGLASALLDGGRVAEAAARLDAAERLEPRHPAMQVTRARVALAAGDWPAVLDRARRARAVDPRRGDASMLEAQALVRLGRRDEADRALDSLRARSPGLPEADALQGELRLAQGRPADAARLLRSAARWMGGDAALWRTLAMAELAAGHPAEARDALRRTVALAPGAYEAWLELAHASRLSGDAAGRDAALDRASRLPGAADGRADSLRRAWGSGS